MPKPRSDKPWRQRKVRISFVEDTLMRLLDSVDDQKARLVIYQELATLRAKEKVLYEERVRSSVSGV